MPPPHRNLPNMGSTSGHSVARMLQDAAVLHRNGRLDEAVGCYRHVLRTHPLHPEALHLLGVIHAQQGRLQTAARLMQQSLSVDSGLAETHNNFGRVLHDLGRYEEAILSYEQAIALRPSYVIAYNNLGTAFAALNRYEEAAARYKAALQYKADYVEAMNNLGALLHTIGRSEEAAAQLRVALDQQPGFIDAEINLAKVLDALDRPGEAAGHYRAAVAKQPDNGQLQLGLAASLHRTERYHEAETCYRRAIEIAPNSIPALLGLGNLLLELGRLSEAINCIENAIAIEPNNLRLYLALARAKKFSPADTYLEALLALASNIDILDQREQIDAHFTLGSVFAGLGQHEQSFTHILAGSRLKRATIVYDEAKALRRIEDTKKVFTRDFIRARESSRASSSLPIFIVGMPRSGSTLVEQVLASHSAVYGAGELSYLAETLGGQSFRVPGSSFLQSVSTWTSQQLQEVEEEYIRKLQAVLARSAPSSGIERVTDKMLDNFRYVGLIHMAMPNAKIIHTYRDPIDTCLSCFSIQFKKVRFSYDLAELGRYYSAYSRLMRHWRTILPVGAMLEVRYGDFVSNFEVEARRLVAYCGLPWDDACMRFHETRRPVRTASVTQVRQPIYRDSISRWRPNETLLRPLLDALEIDDNATE